MPQFDRRLSDRALQALAKMSADNVGNWWRDLIALWAPSGHHGELRLAIRNGYMNFYSCGQSIARIEFGRDGMPKLHINRKYVTGTPSGGQNYVRLLAHQGCDRTGEVCAWGGPPMVRAWIGNSVKHRGPEKCAVETAVAEMPTVIDLEMGLPAGDGRKAPLRMDMVALERTAGGIQIVFWEAKMIGDGRLRSRTTPEVFKQVEAYERFLALDANRERVIEAYRRACKLLCHLNASARRAADTPAIDNLVHDAARDDSPLEIASKPRLLIFDDGARRDEEVWQQHLERLRYRVPATIIPPRTPAELCPGQAIGRDGFQWVQHRQGS